MAKIGRVLLLCAVLMSVSGCAVIDRENRHLSRAVSVLWPESTCARVAVAPVVGPLWVAALAVDALVVNPVLNIPKSFFTALGINGMVPTVPWVEIMVFPLRVVTFPLLVVGADVFYSSVPL